MWLKTRKRLRRLGTGYILFGGIFLVLHIIAVIDEVRLMNVMGIIMGAIFILQGVFMVRGKGFKFEE